MKSVLISIQPKWCELIASGKKTVEVRKTKPKLEPPFKCYIYCTKGKGDCLWRWNGIWYDTQDPKHRPNRLDGKIIGEFVCDDVTRIINFITHFGVERRSESELNTIARASCLDYMDMLGYLGTDKDGYAWHISDLKIYDHPKKLSEFRRDCPDNVRSCAMCKHGDYTGMKCTPIARPPQSWCYVEEVE